MQNQSSAAAITPSFAIGAFIIELVLPVAFSVIGSIRFPIRVIITPLDINIMTFAVFVFSTMNPNSFLFPNPDYLIAYVTTLMLFAIILFTGSLFQNQIASNLLGREGSEVSLNKKVYHTDTSLEKTIDTFELPEVKKETLNILYTDYLDDGSVIFRANPEPYRYRIAVFKQPNDEGSFVAILAYHRDSIGIRQTSDRYFNGICAKITASVPELKLKEVDKGEQIIPKPIISNVLDPLRGVTGWLRKAGKEYVQNLALLVVTVSIAVILRLVNVITDTNLVEIAFLIILTQVGKLALNRRIKQSSD